MRTRLGPVPIGVAVPPMDAEYATESISPLPNFWASLLLCDPSSPGSSAPASSSPDLFSTRASYSEVASGTIIAEVDVLLIHMDRVA